MHMERTILDSFDDILRQALNSKSNSRPPKMELTGLLMPCYQELHSQTVIFKLGTKSDEYLLPMNTKLAHAAKNAVWEVVTVRGHLDLESNVFNVEKITLTQTEEPILERTNLKDEIDTYKRIINQRGKLEPAIEHLAS